MKSILLVLAGLVMSSTAFAQGAAPFWESLTGPAGSQLSFAFLPDSTIAQQVGGALYVYDSAARKWVPSSGEENMRTQERSWRFMTSPAHTLISNILSSHNDTVFYSKDSGETWRKIGTFGSGATRSVLAAILMSTRIVLLDDSKQLYSTPDGFETIDTGRAPVSPENIFGDADTLYLSALTGDLHRSSDFGKTWTKVLDLRDTATNWGDIIWKRGSTWILGAIQLTYNPIWSNLHLAYSLDRGNTWRMMTAPVTDDFPQLEGIDNEGRIYVYFSKGLGVNYRSDDWGQTWKTLSITTPGLLIGRDGTVYSGNLYSRDHGETWLSVSSAEAACLPIDMIAFNQSTVVSTSSGISDSKDDGEAWMDSAYRYFPNYGSSDIPAHLSLRPDRPDVLMVNTTKWMGENGKPHSICGSTGGQPRSGVGAVTSSWNVWIVGNQFQHRSTRDSTGTVERETYAVVGSMSESTDTGCNYYSFPYDTLSPTPITQVMESEHDTILAVSRSGVYRGFDILTPFDTVTPEPSTGAMPTGAMMKDSAGAIYVAMSDGKIFVTSDDAMTWRPFATPTDARAPITSLASVPNGKVLAVDSNLETGFTRTWLYDPEKTLWIDVTYGLKRSGFPNTAIVTNVWYVNGYAYAGTWNMGLFRSHKPVTGIESVETEAHSTPFKLYPNPAASKVTFTYPAAQDNYEYRLLDITGHEIAHGPIARNSTSTEIDLRSIASGQYEVTFNGWLVGKLVVKR